MPPTKSSSRPANPTTGSGVATTPAWTEQAMTARLVLADGTVIEGTGLGATGHASGELCFNTAITGYQEILTDPSYAGQIISLHQMVDVDLSFLSIDIKRFAHGRAKQLVEIRGPRWKRKKNGFTIQQFAEWERLNWSPYAGRADPEGHR